MGRRLRERRWVTEAQKVVRLFDLRTTLLIMAEYIDVQPPEAKPMTIEKTSRGASDVAVCSRVSFGALAVRPKQRTGYSPEYQNGDGGREHRGEAETMRRVLVRQDAHADAR
jgi:hypothetical protein